MAFAQEGPNTSVLHKIKCFFSAEEESKSRRRVKQNSRYLERIKEFIATKKEPGF